MIKSNLVINTIRLVMIYILFSSYLILSKNHILQAQKSFDLNFVYITIITFVFHGLIGGLLGLNSNIFSTSQTSKKLNIDRMKLLIIGIPSFIVSMSFIWGLLGLFDKLPIISNYMTEVYLAMLISSIIFGHTISSSINRV